MEKIKIENFIKHNKYSEFPDYQTLDREELEKLQRILKRKLGLEIDVSLLTVMKKLSDIGPRFLDFDAEEENFSFRDVLSTLKISAPKMIYINWYRFDDVDKMRFEIFCKYFDDIWYPGVDDIEIFDESFSWIIFIRHDGALNACQVS